MTTVKGTLNVDEAVTLDAALDVTGDTSVSTFDSSGATSLATGGGVVSIASTGVMTTVKGTLNVDEAVTLDTTLDVTGDTSVSTFDSSGATSLATGGGIVNIASTGVMTTVKGTLNVDEAVTLDTTLGVTGTSTMATINSSGVVSLTNTTTSTTSTTGALKVSGGVGIADNCNVAGTVSFGTLTDTGTSIAITNFVDHTAGIANNVNNTTIPTCKAVDDFIIFNKNNSKIDIDSDNNLFIGTTADNLDTTVAGDGENNTSLGVDALNDISTGFSNTGVGRRAGKAITTGDDNTCIGKEAGFTLTEATQNTFIGSKAGKEFNGANLTGSNNICIGFNANPSAANASNEITLGNSSITELRCADTAIASLSDERDKKDVIDLPWGLDFIDTLRPVQFTWERRVLSKEDENHPKNGKKRAGFLAQDFQRAMPNNENEILDLVYECSPERIEAKYGNLIPMLTQAIKDLKAQNEALMARVEALENKN
jgi:hypothetical protein